MAVREALWDCQYCGQIGIRGRRKACSSCGRSRPDGTTFYLPENAAAVEEASLLKQAAVGPDWICAFCGSSNAADVEICRSCGAPREATSQEQAVTDYAPGQAPSSGDMDLDEPISRPMRSPAPAAKRRPLIGATIAAVLVVAVGIFVAIVLFGGRDVAATVTGFEWQRTVEIEELRTVEEEGWDVPGDGRIVDQRREVRSYDQVLVGYETKQRQVSERVQVGQRTYVCGQRDLGNGFFEDIECTEPVYETQSRTESYDAPIYRQEPVYDTLYVYEVDRWVTDRTAAASARDHSPYWPATNLAADEREGERDGEYLIYLSDDEESYTWELEQEEWQSFELGQQVEIEFNAFGNISAVNP
ncbi:MAG: hypothetical protein R3300_13830 [Candidatus Promineifilaceae bacterium]|nr:hypothetical protein [Candidatus Promineifilaceae bacterium]